MQEERVSIQGHDGTIIPAILTVPDVPNSSTLMLHGLFGSKDEYGNAYRKLAAELAEAGVISLRIDFRGHGDSPSPLAAYTSQHQAMDALRSFDWLLDQFPDLPASVLATSFGALAGITTTHARQQRVACLVLIAPVLDYERTFLFPTTEWGASSFGLRRILDSLESGLDLGDGYILSPESALDLLLVNPFSALSRLSETEVRIVHGERDSLVPVEISATVARQLSWVDFHVMPNTDHGLSEVDDTERASPQSKQNSARVVSYLRRSDKTAK